MSQKINLDVTPGLFKQVLRVHQGDVGRQFEIAVVTRDGYEIPSGATFKIEATKPSGMGFSVTGTASGNVITFTTTTEMTDEAGNIPAQLRITSGDTVIFASNFLMSIEANAHPEGTTDGSHEVIVSEITLLVERAEAAASTAASDAASAAQAQVDEMMNYLPSQVTDLKNELHYNAQTNLVQGVLADHNISSSGYYVDGSGVNLYYADVSGYTTAVVTSDDTMYAYSDVIPFHNGRTNDNTRHEEAENLNNTEITIPSGTKYLVIRAFNVVPSILVKGSIALVANQNQKDLVNLIGNESIDLSALSLANGYINDSGAIASHANYKHTTVGVALKAGDVITYTTSNRKVESPVVILARVVGTSLIPVQKSNGSDFSYTITIPQDGDYVFSCYISSLAGTTVIRTYIASMARKTMEYVAGSNNTDYIPLFHNVICIGDSLTRGYNTTYGSADANRDFGYPNALSRLTRLNVYNYGHSGATVESWLNSESGLDYSPFDMAIICLGRNGGLASATEQTAYQSIITNIKNSNPHCTIFALSLPAYKDTIQSADATTNGIIESIADTNNIPYVDIWGSYGAEEYRCGENDPHYKPVGYLKMAETIIEKINEYIRNNESDFINLWMPKTKPLYIDGLVE